MSIAKDLKKATTKVLGNGSLTTSEKVVQIARFIEQAVAFDVSADRERAIRISRDGIYVMKNAGSYATKSEADRALETISRLTRRHE